MLWGDNDSNVLDILGLFRTIFALFWTLFSSSENRILTTISIILFQCSVYARCDSIGAIDLVIILFVHDGHRIHSQHAHNKLLASKLFLEKAFLVFTEFK